MPHRRILVAIDGSEPADRALALAFELVRVSTILETEQRGAERDLAERAERSFPDSLSSRAL